MLYNNWYIVFYFDPDTAYTTFHFARLPKEIIFFQEINEVFIDESGYFAVEYYTNGYKKMLGIYSRNKKK